MCWCADDDPCSDPCWCWCVCLCVWVMIYWKMMAWYNRKTRKHWNAVKHNKTQLCTNFVTSSPKDGPQHISLCCSTPQHQKRIWGKEGEGYQTLSKFQKQTRFCLIPCVRVSNLVHKSMKVFVWVRCGVQAILYVSHITHDLTSSVI